MSKLVEFNTATLAKGKGFSYVKANCYGDNMAYDTGEHKGALIQSGNALDYILAPTQSQLQTWLREKHRIHVSVNPWRDDMYDADEEDRPAEGFQVLYEGNVIDVNDDWNIFSPSSYFSSYEECLENCLINGLNLIDQDKLHLDFSQITDIEFSDINHCDAPDYVDAFVERALYKGFPATREELDTINANSEFVHDSLINILH